MSSGFEVGIVETDVGPIEAPVDRWIWPSLRDDGTWEPAVGDLLRAIVAAWGDPPRAWEERVAGVVVGAHVGYHVLGLARAMDAAGFGHKVFAFEPSGANRRLLQRNVAEWEDVDIRAAAVDEYVGDATLWCSPDNSGDMHMGDAEGATRGVPTAVTALDAEALGRVGVVLIDAQGSDLRVLAGGRQTIDRWRPHIILEWTPDVLPREEYVEVERLLADGWTARLVELDKYVDSALGADSVLARRRWGTGSLHLAPPPA